VPTEKLTLTFNTTTSISTCAPHDRLLATGTPECKASWNNAKELLPCPEAIITTMPPDDASDASTTTAAGAAAVALAALGTTVVA
jgi:hypothetical protein